MGGSDVGTEAGMTEEKKSASQTTRRRAARPAGPTGEVSAEPISVSLGVPKPCQNLSPPLLIRVGQATPVVC